MNGRFAAIIILLALATGGNVALAQTPSDDTIKLSIVYPIYLALAAIVGLTVTLLVYLWSLRNRTANMVDASAAPGESLTSRITSFNQLPMGVPNGTIRGILALLITFGSVVFLAVSLINNGPYKFPESLSGILGMILGFYFGKNATGDEGAALAAVTAANEEARKSRSTANDATEALTVVKASNDSLVTSKLDEIGNGLSTAAQFGQTLAAVLPGSIGRDIGIAADALAKTQSAVTALKSGDLIGAVSVATDLVTGAGNDLPVVQVMKKAIQLIGPVLGTAFPPAAMIAAIVGVGSRLGAAAYARWVARVMDEVYTPGKFSATVFDSNAAVSLLMQVPPFMTAFSARLQAGDRDAALDAVQLALVDDNGAGLFAKYGNEFAGLDQPARDAALAQLRKAALDFVLLRDLPADAGANVGGPQALLDAVDKIRGNRDASAGLDLVMQTASELKKAQQSPAAAFDDAAKRLSTTGATS